MTTTPPAVCSIERPSSEDAILTQLRNMRHRQRRIHTTLLACLYTLLAFLFLAWMGICLATSPIFIQSSSSPAVTLERRPRQPVREVWFV